MAEACVNCGHPVLYARDRCRPCYLWNLRKGTDRTEEMIVRAERRAFERELLHR